MRPMHLVLTPAAQRKKAFKVVNQGLRPSLPYHILLGILTHPAPTP